MPYPRHKPVSEEEMLKPATDEEMAFSRYAGHHTICQTLRDIWATTDDDEVKMKCRLAMAMAKAMHRKLKDYNQKFAALNAAKKEG